jgi:hypothetical protein
MLKEGKLAGEGEGNGNQLGDWAGGEKPMKEADGLSAEFPIRNWFIEVGFGSCVFINEYEPSLYPEEKLWA